MRIIRKGFVWVEKIEVIVGCFFMFGRVKWGLKVVVVIFLNFVE